jgi:CRP-like cAMP-binding protein
MLDVSAVKLFAGLPRKELDVIARQLKEVSHAAGDVIMTTGRPGIGFFVILDGQCEVLVRRGHSHKLGPGEHFGEMALLDEQGRSATVTALNDMRLGFVAEWEFKAFLGEHPEVAYHLLQSLGGRLREAEAD